MLLIWSGRQRPYGIISWIRIVGSAREIVLQSISHRVGIVTSTYICVGMVIR